jgi:hypothetical protein
MDTFTEKELQLKYEFDVRCGKKTLDSKMWLKKMGYIVYTQDELNEINLIKAGIASLLTISTWIVIILIMAKLQVYCGA